MNPIAQLIFGIIFLVFSVIAASNGEINRFLAFLIISNIWIAAANITSNLKDK